MNTFFSTETHSRQLKVSQKLTRQTHKRVYKLQQPQATNTIKEKTQIIQGRLLSQVWAFDCMFFGRLEHISNI